MEWIIISFLLILASISQYILLHQSQRKGISDSYNNLALFLVPAGIYLFVALVKGISLYVSLNNLVLLFLAAFFLSFLGSKFSLKSMSISPDPGYSLIISKSYIIFTAFISIVFLHLPFQPENIYILAALVLLSTVLVLMNNIKTKNKLFGVLWITYALMSFFAWGILVLVVRYFLNQGLSSIQFLFYIVFFASLCIIIELVFKRPRRSLKSSDIKILLLIGTSSACFNFLIVEGYQFAPNPLYINAANASSIGFLTILAFLIFKKIGYHMRVIYIGIAQKHKEHALMRTAYESMLQYTDFSQFYSLDYIMIAGSSMKQNVATGQWHFPILADDAFPIAGGETRVKAARILYDSGFHGAFLITGGMQKAISGKWASKSKHLRRLAIQKYALPKNFVKAIGTKGHGNTLGNIEDMITYLTTHTKRKSPLRIGILTNEWQLVRLMVMIVSHKYFNKDNITIIPLSVERIIENDSEGKVWLKEMEGTSQMKQRIRDEIRGIGDFLSGKYIPNNK